ncbi:DsbA family oxidoreductase [Phyllobacterium sp. 0TCS1.6C]|uniref:DsbA family oxidoreductase n=1 Tax=unclassified Phyllobacterium TaxID=2638441 RepID=UPI0022651917|nr:MULTISPECIES: DsbA family oxidoreductase [unclassified Phyllobacterium]MCX8282232.1 DsbA family oxidoreductase [Phyllobacterium sp. 0TCS1.6C]MCX8294920.1 DsbA family oxidoreductase [Phyllobacterium sp. 0TCS1.6A]
MIAKKITIDVVSDVVCPWCFVGRKRLEQALALNPDLDATVNWRPFQLDPTIPAKGKDRQRYMQEKFGSSDRIFEVHQQLTELGGEVGIEFDFEAIQVSPNTLDAHRLIRWAAQATPNVQDELVGILFSYYFEQGKDIGDRQILLEAAAEAGLDAAIVESLLPTDADVVGVRQEIDMASQVGVRGVPCFILDQKYAIMGAQSADVLADAIRQTADGYEPRPA